MWLHLSVIDTHEGTETLIQHKLLPTDPKLLLYLVIPFSKFTFISATPKATKVTYSFKIRVKENFVWKI